MHITMLSPFRIQKDSGPNYTCTEWDLYYRSLAGLGKYYREHLDNEFSVEALLQNLIEGPGMLFDDI